MNGVFSDIFLSGTVNFLLLFLYIGIFVLDMLYYFLLVKLFKAENFNDKVVFYHQVPIIPLVLLGFVVPSLWYVACLHLVAHFLAETIFLAMHKVYEYTIHHIYTVIYLGSVALFTPPLICLLALPPMLNNTIYHGAISFGLMAKTKVFRHWYFILCRIVYPPLMMLYLLIFTNVNIAMKVVLSFFAVTIVALMAPKIGSINDFGSNFKSNSGSNSEQSRETSGVVQGSVNECGDRMIDGWNQTFYCCTKK
ncbi:hypothetical protein YASMINEVIRUS_865 [Yasminevirus sp. GU-2018]|uniref:Uncharacterized protein n=1 Tax=Yasminevirus sp. GU-2018 TaxID=2420051 RepID=A0A5K0UA79_9VIRU|nr:hypothetical protein YASMINEVIRUS_865 [Yasminevirus sp. GU-2018]